MKSLRIALPLLLSLAVTGAFAQSSAQKSFDQLKSLDGSWEGKGSDGRPLRVSFRDVARGTALMSEIQKKGLRGGNMFNMISMIHLDGPNRLLLDHYCVDGTQTRMAATTSPDGKTITFDFLDDTNTTPDSTNARRLIFTIVDANHYTEGWTFAAGRGKETKEFFDLHRTEVAPKK